METTGRNKKQMNGSLVSAPDRFTSARDSGNGAQKSAVVPGRETKLSNGRNGKRIPWPVSSSARRDISPFDRIEMDYDIRSSVGDRFVRLRTEQQPKGRD